MSSFANNSAHVAGVRISPDLPETDWVLLREFVMDLPPADDRFADDADYQDDIELIRRQYVAKTARASSKLQIEATISVVADLAKQGWRFVLSNGQVIGHPPSNKGREARQVKQAQLLAQRNEQLRLSSTRQFVNEMERSRLYRDRRVSMFSLMRDGRELAENLRKAGTAPERLREVVDPYLQFVDSKSRCEHTGLRLTDIWRYFRHTWSSPYNSIPGRTMMFLVRDRAADCHPVIGLGALSSASVKLRPRDDAIGWEADSVLDEVRATPAAKVRLFEWMRTATERWLGELYRVDFVEEGLLPNDLDQAMDERVIEKLQDESKRAREVHNRLMGSGDYKKTAPTDDDGQDEHWEEQARWPLFRSKRASDFAALLSIRRILLQAADSFAPAEAVDYLIGSAAGRRTIAQVIRRAKAQSVGTCIADLTVCGAVPPYGPLLGGKLVAMLAVGPEMVSAYRRRYGRSVSIIASSMAGRPIIRPAELAFIGTTSLYGIRPCQYDRISLPLDRICGDAGDILRYEYMSATRGWGTFHFGSTTARALGAYVRAKKGGVQVNYVFGEGANPRLRALREGLALLGLDEESLLYHGNQKLIYGVRLISNLRNYLLGIETRPKYRFSMRSARGSSESIVEWWIERWLTRRLNREDASKTLQEVWIHSLVHPITHGARVALPDEDLEHETLFE
jgi:hypothetical protein